MGEARRKEANGRWFLDGERRREKEGAREAKFREGEAREENSRGHKSQSTGVRRWK